MRIILAAALDRLRLSMFVIPALGVLGGIGLGGTMLAIDRSIGWATALPLVLASTVDSARAVLSTVATATISVAGVAFSISVLVLQQASGQFSPRVVRGLFRDPFNRRVMAVAVGTFTYCLVVLRAVRAPEDVGVGVVVPHLSVFVAVLSGVAAILAIIGLIDHVAHSMEVSEILHRVLGQALAAADDLTPGERDDAPAPEPAAAHRGRTVRARRNGWIQRVDLAGMLGAAPEGSVVRLETGVGHFVFEGSPLATVWPSPADADADAVADAVAERIHDGVTVGASRTVQQDPAYGIRQLVDVALIALSPGVNDPTTGQDAILHAGALLTRLLVLPRPAVRRDERGTTLLLPHEPSPAELVELTFSEARRAAATLPTVCVYVLQCLAQVRTALEPHEVATDAVAAIEEQARLVVAGARRADLLPEDLTLVQDAYTRYFAPDGSTRPLAR